MYEFMPAYDEPLPEPYMYQVSQFIIAWVTGKSYPQYWRNTTGCDIFKHGMLFNGRSSENSIPLIELIGEDITWTTNF